MVVLPEPGVVEFEFEDPIVRPLASRNVTRPPCMVADPVDRPLASRKVMRSPDRVALPVVRPLASLKSDLSVPLLTADCHCLSCERSDRSDCAKAMFELAKNTTRIIVAGALVIDRSPIGWPSERLGGRREPHWYFGVGRWADQAPEGKTQKVWGFPKLSVEVFAIRQTSSRGGLGQSQAALPLPEG